MRNLKRVLSLAMALVMVLGMMVITTNAADFTDAEEITYKEAVEVMAEIGILKGMGDGTFAPKGTLTRAQAAKILAFVTLGTDADNYLTGAETAFTDVAADHWAAKYIAYCDNLGIIDGNGDGTYNPDGVLTVTQFAKLLLGALNVDGKFTGAGWEENVKKAFNGIDELKNTGIKVTNANITREEACELALAAMVVPTVATGYEVYDVETEEVIKSFESLLDAKLYAADVNAVLGAGSVAVQEATDTGSLLFDNYEYRYNDNAQDKYGRPGNSYTTTVAGEDVVMFYVDEALAKFEGPVAEKALFAASKYAGTNNYIPYTVIEDGNFVKHSDTTFYACKATKQIKEGQTVVNDAEWFAAGTGYGIKSELYKVGTSYKLISIREYLGTVTVPEVAANADRVITVTLADGTVLANYKTEEFKANDKVIVTIAGDEIQTIALAESVKGTLTETSSGSGTADNLYYTIDGVKYVKSQNFDANITLTINGEEAEWYVDSFGNLMGDKTVQQNNPTPVYYYGYLLSYAKQAYVAAGTTTDLLGKGSEEVAAAEIFKFINAAGEIVTLNGAFKVENKTAQNPSGTTTFAANADFSYTPAVDETPASYTKNVLFKYELNADGTIKSADVVGTADDVNSYEIKKGVPTLAGSKFGTDKTVYFMIDTNNNLTAVYTGYANVPNKTGTLTDMDANGTSGEVYALVMSATLTAAPDTDTYAVFFADTAYTTKWDAEEEDTYVLYEGVYVDGVKVEGGLKFADVQDVVKGEMYAVTIEDGICADLGQNPSNLLSGTDVVTLIQSGYVKAGSNFIYVDADTVYFQIDATKGTITAVEALPEVDTENEYAITVLLTVVALDAEATDPVVAVYFSVGEVVEET